MVSPAYSPEEQRLAELLRRTASQDVADMKVAEGELRKVETQPGFAMLLLQVLHKSGENCLQLQRALQQNNGSSPELDAAKRVTQAGAIFFKNYIKKHYPLFGEGGLPTQDRTAVKENLVQLLMLSPEMVQKQLIASVEEIAICDFPFEWTNLVPDLKKSLKANPEQAPVILETLQTAIKHFEVQALSDELLKKVKYCVDEFSKEHL
eukprot:gene100-400_t